MLNAKWLAEDEDLTLLEARNRFEEGYERLRAFLGSLPPEQ